MAPSFDFKKRLGSGYFGEVWLAVDTGLNYECALKCIPPDKVINKDNFYQEAQVLKAAEHPNIIKVVSVRKPPVWSRSRPGDRGKPGVLSLPLAVYASEASLTGSSLPIQDAALHRVRRILPHRL